jgi:endonuclease/exonuclease/phosphatase family metal-dependent hydrolase
MTPKRRYWGWLVLGVFCLVLRSRCGEEPLPPTRVATFNIENYPKSERQEEGAFALLKELQVSAVAVQEITEPRRFRKAARRRLGRKWRFAYPRNGPVHRIGVLYDRRVFKLESTRTYDETVIDGAGKPAFEARLKPQAGGRVVRMIAVHLKAGGEPSSVAMRQRQLRALRPVLVKAVTSKDRVYLLGDFNATSPEDRVEIASLAQASRLDWSSRELPCSSYWNRNDGCVGSPLDHVVAMEPPSSVAARGPCETEGCARRDRCPVFHAEVSDHCPVTVELAP